MLALTLELLKQARSRQTEGEVDGPPRVRVPVTTFPATQGGR
jgi:hypothetical protein